MASYKVTLKPSVEKDLRSLSKSAIARVVKSLERLAEIHFLGKVLSLRLENNCIGSGWEITEQYIQLIRTPMR